MIKPVIKILVWILSIGLFGYLCLAIFGRITRNFPYYKMHFNSPATVVKKVHKLPNQSSNGKEQWLLYVRIENFDALPEWIRTEVIKQENELYEKGIYEEAEKSKNFYMKTNVGDRLFAHYEWEGKGKILFHGVYDTEDHDDYPDKR